MVAKGVLGKGARAFQETHSHVVKYVNTGHGRSGLGCRVGCRVIEAVSVVHPYAANQRVQCIAPNALT